MAQVVFRGEIVDHGHRPERSFVVNQAPRFDGERAPGVGIDPLARREILSRLEGLAQKRREPAADRFDRLVQRVPRIDPENLFRRRIEPANVRLFIGGDNSRRNGFEERFGQRLLDPHLLIEERVFQDGGDVFPEDH